MRNNVEDVRDMFAAAALKGLLITAGEFDAVGNKESQRLPEKQRDFSTIPPFCSLLSDARSLGWGSELAGHSKEDKSPMSIAQFLAMESFCIAEAMMQERARVLNREFEERMSKEKITEEALKQKIAGN